jgi:hypothetical membrane protein
MTRPARWPGPVLVVAVLVNATCEAIVAAAWDVRPYSYVDDYINFLGSPFVGDFQGFVISSPLWFVMSAAWIVSGVLVAVAGIRLSRDLTGWPKRLVAGFAVLQAVALILFAAVPLDPATIESGLLAVYLTGAFLSIITGNALAITAGASWRQLGLPRAVGVAGVVLGAVGLVNVPATYGWLATGIAERISVYTFFAWAVLTGVALAVRPAPALPVAPGQR